MCKVEGCGGRAETGPMCQAHVLLSELGFDLQEFSRLTEGYSAEVIIRESIKRTLAALRRVSERA